MWRHIYLFLFFVMGCSVSCFVIWYDVLCVFVRYVMLCMLHVYCNYLCVATRWPEITQTKSNTLIYIYIYKYNYIDYIYIYIYIHVIYVWVSMCRFTSLSLSNILYNILYMIYYSTLQQTIIVCIKVFLSRIPCVAPFAYYQDVIEAHFIFRASSAISWGGTE